MDENNLLLGKVIPTSGKRKFVEHRKIQAIYPMEYLCLDIKYIWVSGEKRNLICLHFWMYLAERPLNKYYKAALKNRCN